jgi:hypothetical protein
MKKLIAYAITAAIFLTACNSNGKLTNSGADSASVKLERNKRTALKTVQYLSDKHLDSMLVALAPGFVDYGSGDEQPKTNIDSIKADLKGYMQDYPNLTAQKMNALAHGDSVVVTATWVGKLNIMTSGTRLEGKPFSFDDADIFIFNSAGKIKAHRSVQNKELFFGQFDEQ